MDAPGIYAGEVWKMIAVEMLYSKGGMISDGVVAGKRIDEHVVEQDEKHRSVINPCVGELVAMMGQVDEFKEVQQRYMTQRIAEGASAEVAKKEADGITKEVIKKAKDLKKEQILKRHKVMEQIEAKLPQVDGELAEVRGKILTDYLEKHGAGIIAEVERYTLDELRAETEFYGTTAQKGFHETLLNCINESDITEHELELHTAEGIGEALNAGAETFNQLMIPGYAAWADGGTTTEVVASASSDVVLTLVGGKVVKIAWAGSKALVQGAAKFGKSLMAGKIQVVDRQLYFEQPKMIKHHLFNRFWQQTESSLKYREFFQKHGIKVDDFCVELPRTTHVKHVHNWQNDWTNRWKQWIDANPEATTREVYQFAGRLMDEYGISHLPIVKYYK